MKKMKQIIVLLIPFIIISCKSEKGGRFYPDKKESMSEGIYQKYKSKLDSAYTEKDHFEIGMQLSNLEAPSDEIYRQIKKGIKGNSENCYRVYEWHKLFVENNFQINLVKSDKLKFIETYKLCEEVLGQQAFIDYQTKKEVEYQEKLAKRKKLDSTKFDLFLIEELKLIKNDDQRYRLEMDKYGVTKEEKQDLWNKQNYLDSINLNKIEEILKGGYPSKEKIGYEHLSTIWLVLHHQGNYNIRQKYLPVLKKAVENGNLGKGSLSVYEWRNDLIRLKNEN